MAPAPPAAPDNTPLLQVRQLGVQLRGAHGPLAALRGVDITLQRGQALGLIGESGCGKSLTALALMGLLPDGATAQGSIRLAGQELLGLPEATWCGLRGQRIGMVFQEPMTALNPLHTIGAQVAEPLRLHRGLDARSAQAEALRLLQRVRLPQAAQRLRAWPHQLSGGQRQRVVIAMALACGPELLVADEPTSALDATLQHEVLALMLELVREAGMGLLLISHDLALVARHVHELAVMYSGRVVEQGPVQQVFAQPAHPYTLGLLGARPRLGLPRGTRLPTIPGRVPPLHALPPGCAFAPRCNRASAACPQALPELQPIAGNAHRVACLHPHHTAAGLAA